MQKISKETVKKLLNFFYECCIMYNDLRYVQKKLFCIKTEKRIGD